MNRGAIVEHLFVDVVPDTLEQGVVYVCIRYTTAVHLCMCGCGEEVVTPIKPTGWRITFDGVAISLHPSIGNWDFSCRSHYWITDGRVRWDRQWAPQEIAVVRKRENAERVAYFGQPVAAARSTSIDDSPPARGSRPRRVLRWLARQLGLRVRRGPEPGSGTAHDRGGRRP